MIKRQELKVEKSSPRGIFLIKQTREFFQKLRWVEKILPDIHDSSSWINETLPKPGKKKGKPEGLPKAQHAARENEHALKKTTIVI